MKLVTGEERRINMIQNAVHLNLAVDWVSERYLSIQISWNTLYKMYEPIRKLGKRSEINKCLDHSLK